MKQAGERCVSGLAPTATYPERANLKEKNLTTSCSPIAWPSPVTDRTTRDREDQPYPYPFSNRWRCGPRGSAIQYIILNPFIYIDLGTSDPGCINAPVTNFRYTKPPPGLAWSLIHFLGSRKSISIGCPSRHVEKGGRFPHSNNGGGTGGEG